VAADSQLGQAAGPETVTEVSDTADLSMPVRCRMCRIWPAEDFRSRFLTEAGCPHLASTVCASILTPPKGQLGRAA